jgi:hypothetical protein
VRISKTLLRRFAVVSWLLAAPNLAIAGGTTIDFVCSWDNASPITISVDSEAMTATRSDGGRSYTVAKITKWGVWLIVDGPGNIAAMAVQMIQRGEAVTPDSERDAGTFSAGTWTDVIMSISGQGTVSPIRGGIGWEQKEP